MKKGKAKQQRSSIKKRFFTLKELLESVFELEASRSIEDWSIKQVLLANPREGSKAEGNRTQAGPLERTLGQEGASAGSGETEFLGPGPVRSGSGSQGSWRVPATPARHCSQTALAAGVGA